VREGERIREKHKETFVHICLFIHAYTCMNVNVCLMCIGHVYICVMYTCVYSGVKRDKRGYLSRSVLS